MRIPHDDVWDSGEILPPDVTAAEAGLFFFLASRQYKFGPLPNHEPTIALWCSRWHREFPKVWPRVKLLFPINAEGRLENAWVASEVANAEEYMLEQTNRKRKSRGLKPLLSRGRHRDNVDVTVTSRGRAVTSQDVTPTGQDITGQDRTGEEEPPTPLRGKRGKRAVGDLPTADELLAAHPGLNTPAFRSAWETWMRYRVEIRHPYKSAIGVRQAVKELAGWGPQRAVAAIEYTMAKGWQGIQEPKGENGRPTPHRSALGTLPYNPEND